jgi:hypothetical protein
MARKAYAAGEVHSEYRGALITRAGINSSGIKWTAHVDNPVRGAGLVRSDTLDGIRRMIRWAQGIGNGE